MRAPGSRLVPRIGLFLLLAGVEALRAQGKCNDMWPAWSPDGKQIVFASDRTGDWEIYVLRLGDREPRRLTSAPGRDAHPAWSPDGKTIAFQSPREGAHTNLYLMNSDGSGQRKITSHEGFAGVPAFSPDGRQIAYQWTGDMENFRGWRVMMTAPAPGAATRALTDGKANDQVPNWSPDGKRLIFYSDRTGVDQLYTMTPDGADVVRLTDAPAADRTGAYSPDGKTIAFMSEREGKPAAIFLMHADGTHVRRIGKESPEHGVPFFSPDGRSLLLSPGLPAGRQIWSMQVTDAATRVLSRCTPAPPPK
jgi:Tol biopolymer transport system component